jgi:hypothetical protein
MKKTLVALMALAMIGVTLGLIVWAAYYEGSRSKLVTTVTTPTPVPVATPVPVVHHEVVKLTRGQWKNFGVVGSIYRNDEAKPGTIDGIEGGLMVFKTLSGPVWFADFEPNDDQSSLDQRQVYLVHISGNLASGCGYAMRDFRTAPAQCVMEEKILSWKEAKSFLEPKVSPDPQYWVEIENFLRNREWK